MKKFKGGLYADLSNYNATLPNTEILLNFFKLNPIGYRSGGMVQGIAGGNPTGMRVTGGFLANAQGYQPGGSVAGMSPYELGQYAEQQQRLPYLGTGEFAEEGAPLWSKERAKQELLDPEQLKLNISAYYQKPENLLNLLKIDKGMLFDYSPKTKGITKKGEDVPIWDKDARKYEKGKWKKYSEKEKDASKKSAVDDLLDQYYAEGEMYDVDPSADTLPSDKKEKPKGYPGDRLAQRKIHTGPLPPSKEDIEKAKTEKREKKYKSIDEYTQDTKNEKAESTTSLSGSIEDIKKSDIVGEGEDAEFDIPDKRTSTEIYDTLAKNSGITQLLDQTKEANIKDRELIDTIGKEVYGKKGDKDAPAWAMPLMIAGLQMAASNNPDMLGAMAEGGIKGVEEYARATKEKREDAKDKIELDLKKTELKSKIFDRNMSIATINANLTSTSETLASNELQQINNMKLAKFKTKSENINFDKNLTKEIFFKNQEIDMELLKLAQRKDEFESLDEYNRQKLALEVLKAKNSEVQHETEINLKYRDTGKVTDIMISDAGIPKKAKIRSYYSYKEDKFLTEFVGWSPLSSSEFTSFNDEIYSMAKEQLQELIGQPEYTEKFEDLVTKLWEEKMISLYGTAEDAEAAAEADLKAQSDIRLKTDIKPVGKSPSGVNIYSFKYKDRKGTYEGVMAHEVPWASVMNDNGYLMVDYSKLDVEFKKLN